MPYHQMTSASSTLMPEQYKRYRYTYTCESDVSVGRATEEPQPFRKNDCAQNHVRKTHPAGSIEERGRHVALSGPRL